MSPKTKGKSIKLYTIGSSNKTAGRFFELLKEHAIQRLIDVRRRNDSHLLGYHEGYYQAGSSEIKSWIAMGGAIAGSGLKGNIVDYHALLRTPAGTGSSAAFMYWQ